MVSLSNLVRPCLKIKCKKRAGVCLGVRYLLSICKVLSSNPVMRRRKKMRWGRRLLQLGMLGQLDLGMRLGLASWHILPIQAEVMAGRSLGGSSWAINKHEIPIRHSYLCTASHGPGGAEITSRRH